MTEVTRILDAMGDGDAQAAAQLMPLVYDELRRLAARQMASEKPGQTLDATALVHEAYLRLVDGQRFENRRHFFAAAAEAMRRIRVDRARRKRRHKHGGDCQRVAIDVDALMAAEIDDRLVALDEAFERFTQLEPDKAELVKLRWFAGLSLDAAAELVGVSPSTADRWWSYARAWLRVAIDGD